MCYIHYDDVQIWHQNANAMKAAREVSVGLRFVHCNCLVAIISFEVLCLFTITLVSLCFRCVLACEN